MSKKIFIIILNWNKGDLTIDCLESLYKMSYRDFEVILVDNGSVDDSVDRISAKYPALKIIKNSENLGFTGGNNLGMKEAMKHSPGYIMLLNNDTIVHESMLSELLKAIESNGEIGMVGPKIYYYGDNIIWSAGTWHDRLLHRFKLIGMGHKDSGQFSKKRDVDELTACAMLIRREVIEKVGYLNDDYFTIVEDSEYCLRVKRAGYRLIFVPKSILWHKVSSSSGGEDSPLNIYYSTRNVLYLVKKYYFISLPFILFKYYFKCFLFYLLGCKVKAKASLDAVLDFQRGKKGKSEKY